MNEHTNFFRGNCYERSFFIMRNKTKRMATNAMLAALYFALSMLAVPVGGLKLTFEHLPVIMAAVMFGPVDALIIGGLGELANQTPHPYGHGTPTNRISHGRPAS